MTETMPAVVLDAPEVASDRKSAWQQWQRSTFVHVRRSVRSPLSPLNHVLWANVSELTRTLPRIDKLGVTGSSPARA
jgi:hypothetical protein